MESIYKIEVPKSALISTMHHIFPPKNMALLSSENERPPPLLFQNRENGLIFRSQENGSNGGRQPRRMRMSIVRAVCCGLKLTTAEMVSVYPARPFQLGQSRVRRYAMCGMRREGSSTKLCTCDQSGGV